MKQVVDTGLPHFGRPTEWATMSRGFLFTAAVPVKPDGTFETGAAEAQVELAIANLEKTLKAAGGELTDVLQAIVHLTSAEHVPVLNEVWGRHFKAPFPNRAIVIVSAIGVPGVSIMMQVVAHIGG